MSVNQHRGSLREKTMEKKSINMPKVYKRKEGIMRCGYDKVDLENALQAVRNGMPTRQASEQYGVPRATLSDRVRNNRSKSCGGQPVLQEEEESYLVKGLETCVEWGYSLKKREILDVVQKYLNQKGVMTRFRDNRPGMDWLRNFLKRNPSLAERFGPKGRKARIGVRKKESLDDYFKMVLPYSNEIAQKDSTIKYTDSGVMNEGETNETVELKPADRETVVVFVDCDPENDDSDASGENSAESPATEKNQMWSTETDHTLEVTDRLSKASCRLNIVTDQLSVAKNRMCEIANRLGAVTSQLSKFLTENGYIAE